jgi:hypothetical protein
VLQEGAGGGNAYARSLRRKENVRWWLWIKDILRSCGFHKVTRDKWGLSRFIPVNKNGQFTPCFVQVGQRGSEGVPPKPE